MMNKLYILIFLLMSFMGKGQFFEEKYSIQELIQEKEAAKQLPHSQENDFLYLKALNNLASRYNSIQKFDSSQILSKQALFLAKNRGDNAQIASSMFNLGYSNHHKDLFFEASKYYEGAILASQVAEDDSLLALSYYLGGMCYNDQEEYTRALMFLKKGQNLCEKKRFPNQLTRCLNNIGIIYSDTQKPDSALYFFKKCLRISTQNNIERMIAISYKNVGKSLLSTRKFNEGIMNIEKSIALFLNSKNQKIKDLVVYSYLELAKYYDYKNDIEKANKYAHLGNDLNETLNYSDLKLAFNKILYHNYKSLGQIPKAFLYLEKYQESSDKINQDFLKQQHNALEERFKGEIQKNQIFLLNQENTIKENRFNLLIISFLVSILFVIIVFYLYQTIKKQKVEIEEINQNLEVKVEERTEELKQAYDEIKEAMLNGQTIERKRVAADLHDNLGSILSAVGLSLETLDETKLASKEQVIFGQIKHQITNAYQELRLLSHNLQPEELEKNGLKNTLEKLREKITTNHKIKFSLSIDNLEKLSKIKEFNLYLICLELVNNTLKYARATEIMLSFCKNGESNQLTYSDNGSGFSENIKEGFGLQSIKNRVKQIGATIEMRDQAGLCFVISLE